MAARRTSTKAPEPAEADRFEVWLADFDAREAEARSRLDCSLHTLGVKSVTERETPEAWQYLV